MLAASSKIEMVSMAGKSCQLTSPNMAWEAPITLKE